MGKLVFQRVTKNVSEETFDCGVESINDYVRNSYYPSIAQHAYAYNISGNGKSLGYIQYLFRDVELEYFPDEIADVDPGVKENTLSALHIRFLAIDRRYQNRHIGTAVLEVFIKKVEDKEVNIKINMTVSINRREGCNQAYVSLRVELGEKVDKLLNQNAPSLLLSYVRPVISQLTGASPFEAFNIPFMNFTNRV